MRISVVVPVHNVPRELLAPCLDSLAMQTLRQDEYEIIIVDDCSTSCETIKNVEEFSERTANASVVRHSANLGLNEARWSGVKRASGDYVVFIDGDDPIVRDGLENLRMEAARADADIVTAPMLRWHPLTRTYSDIPLTDVELPENYVKRLKVVLSGECSFSMCGRLFRRELLSDDIFTIPIGLIHEDVTTFPRLAFKAKTISHCAKPFYLYTLNFSSITTRFSRKHPDGIIFGLRDWIENAKSRGLFGELSEAISRGAEKLVKVCVLERCFFSESQSGAEKAQILRDFRKQYFDLGLEPIELKAPAVRFLHEADPAIFEGDPAILLDELGSKFPYLAPSQLKSDQILNYGMGPSEMAQRLKDKIIFVAQVDYQVRNAAAFARELTQRGHTCVVLDNSAFVAAGKRLFLPGEHDIFYRTEHVRVETGPYPVDWLSTAKLVIVFNDFNEDFREALEFRNRLELPSACAVEGISDFLRADFEGYQPLPYRRCGHVLLAGEHDRQYFNDRKTYVTGLPVIEDLSQKDVRFPSEPLAILNVNFTYGALHSERDGFVQKAKAAFEAIGLNWEITQHPMDDGQLDGLPVSDKTQYQLIEECSVFVSRFATGILEALACGKPAIYFNPHHEKVEKFKEPLGAFEIATSEDELAQALRRALKDIEEGVDFRARSQEFLKFHTGYDPDGPSVGALFTAAAIDIMDSCQEARREVSDMFFQLAERHDLFHVVERQDNVVFGEFDRRDRAQLSEAELIASYFGKRGQLMIWPGTNLHGRVDIFQENGWKVCLLKPEPEEATTLPASYKSGDTEHANLLKVDIQDAGRLPLDGFLSGTNRPDVVLAEVKYWNTTPTAYTTQDLAEQFVEKGYSVYISEWMPGVGSGSARNWRRMLRFSTDLVLDDISGNIIGFRDDPGEELVANLIKQLLKFDAKSKLFGVQQQSGPKKWDERSIKMILSDLDRLWVLSLIHERKARQSLFTWNKIPKVDTEDSLPHLVRIAHEFDIAITAPQSFDDERYCRQYPDVAKAIENGEFMSGYEHYVIHGHAEDGRIRPTV
tara:strand:- start:3586 stop:6723 length:3138 start_codon:yes stop_codon:yes gene_type:complete